MPDANIADIVDRLKQAASQTADKPAPEVEALLVEAADTIAALRDFVYERSLLRLRAEVPAGRA